MSTKLVCGLALLASAEAFSPAAPNAAAAVRMPAVSMNTKYTVGRDTIGFKKNKKTGSSANLKGYTVGSRAPAASRSSGTRIDQTARGRYASDGGLLKDPSAKRGANGAAGIGLIAAVFAIFEVIGAK